MVILVCRGSVVADFGFHSASNWLGEGYPRETVCDATAIGSISWFVEAVVPTYRS